MRHGRDALGTAGKLPALLKAGATFGRRYLCGGTGWFDNSLLQEGALRVHNDGCDGTNSGH